MVLRQMCRKVLLDVLRTVKEEKKWKVLIVDEMSIHILSSCFTTIELLEENITVIDDLYGSREPLVNFEAIYIITPIQKAIDVLASDFQEAKCLYHCAHVFFLYAIPELIFDNLCKSTCAKYIKSLKEINIAFVPTESQVFSLYDFDAIKNFCASDEVLNVEYYDALAEKIVTLFYILEEYPVIRYHPRVISNKTLAEKIHDKLEACAQKYFPNAKLHGTKSQLLIIDRGFDCISPLLHELTLQAMVHDVLPVNNNVFQVVPDSGAGEAVEGDEKEEENEEREEEEEEEPGETLEKREVVLDESDAFWTQHRHKHVAHVADYLVDLVEKHSLDDRAISGRKSKGDLRRLSRDMGNIIMLRLKRKFSDYRHMVSQCIEKFSTGIKTLCFAEQDLATGLTSDGDALNEPLRDILQVLRNESFSSLDKIRIILLFILYSGGISESCLQFLATEAELTNSDIQIIRNLGYFGYQIITEDKKMHTSTVVPRRDRTNECVFKASRWTPILKDILELLIDNELDDNEFPYLTQPLEMDTRDTRTRGRAWCKDQVSEDLNYAIIFIVGGATYSEMRCVYEVTKASSGWQVLIGSDHILTPEGFLHEIGQLTENLL